MAKLTFGSPSGTRSGLQHLPFLWWCKKCHWSGSVKKPNSTRQIIALEHFGPLFIILFTHPSTLNLKSPWLCFQAASWSWQGEERVGQQGLAALMKKIIMKRTHPRRKFNFITKETRLFMTIYFQVVRNIILLRHCLWHQIFSNQRSKWCYAYTSCHGNQWDL